MSNNNDNKNNDNKNNDNKNRNDNNRNDNNSQQYRRFVQNNRDLPWAKELLQAVSKVHNAKNHYKTFFPMMCNRNMYGLHKICMDIINNNSPPHREVHGFHPCAMTGVWHNKCIDISRGNRSTAAAAQWSTGVQPEGNPHKKNVAAQDEKAGEKTQSAPTTAVSVPGGVYISPKFKHFAQMLWTLAKLDVIVKNYVSAWLQSRHSSGTSQVAKRCQRPGKYQLRNGDTKQLLISQFSSECLVFKDNLYKIFVHALEHVSNSLWSHINDPTISVNLPV